MIAVSYLLGVKTRKERKKSKLEDVYLRCGGRSNIAKSQMIKSLI